ncbi:RcgA family putative transporter [Pseudaminobacter sp. NGMCC 1.201702]|uniref:RcgA family putative transporter n=1 Tax=Pseudaminobacter sp. NGMCC 1.201702 TaxID=3391825 RepID=UPI0039EFE056
MFRNGKLFLPPPRDGSDFKGLFKRLAAAGAGRPSGKDGFPAGPWTPELLAEAISQIDSNRIGVDLRTVQLWFQENEKGISAANIRWLARVFGCDDPVATSEWQMELSAAQSRLTAKRREWKRAGSGVALAVPDMTRTATFDDGSESPAELARDNDAKGPRRRFSLARKSETFFSHGSPLNLPASVFSGVTALGFLSYMTGIHNVTYGRADGVVKQVGFLWAANWTFVFMLFLPLFFAFVTELVTFWKDEGRPKLVAHGDKMESDDAWARNVEASSYSYWAVFLICVMFAGLFQWIGVSLIPLIKGGGNYATDWGSLAIVRPEVISVPVAVVFTGLAYLYMCLCFYLFFVGLMLLHTVVDDLWRIGEASKGQPEVDYQSELNEASVKVMRWVFRCTVLGILIAIVMKLQSSYLASNGKNIVSWLIGDMSSALYERGNESNRFIYRMPTHYSSLLIVISTCVVFLYGSIRLGVDRRFCMPMWRMSAVIAVLVAGYLLIDASAGFSILLGVGVLLAVYGLFDPGLGRWRVSKLGNNQSVS